MTVSAGACASVAVDCVKEAPARISAIAEQVVVDNRRPVRARRKDTMVYHAPLRCGNWSAMLKSYRHATTASNTSNCVWLDCKARANFIAMMAAIVQTGAQ